MVRGEEEELLEDGGIDKSNMASAAAVDDLEDGIQWPEDDEVAAWERPARSSPWTGRFINTSWTPT